MFITHERFSLDTYTELARPRGRIILEMNNTRASHRGQVHQLPCAAGEGWPPSTSGVNYLACYDRKAPFIRDTGDSERVSVCLLSVLTHETEVPVCQSVLDLCHPFTSSASQSGLAGSDR